MYVISPVNLVESMLPNVSSPFSTKVVFVGSKDTETRSDGMVPWLKKLSVTVGILLSLDGDRVPIDRFVGPRLQRTVFTHVRMDGSPLYAHPRIPSTVRTALEAKATPMDC